MKPIEDERVDRLLRRRGGLSTATIYYSPITEWIRLYAIALVYSFSLFVLPLIKCLGMQCALLILLLHLGTGYLLVAYMSCSVAVGERALHVLNPNFPFLRHEKINFSEVKHIQITKHGKWSMFSFFFLIFATTHVKITTAQGTKTYYCIGIEEDFCDENTVERIIDDLYLDLANRGLPVQFDIEY